LAFEVIPFAHTMSAPVDSSMTFKESAVGDSPLFHLSGELRNEIYRHYFGDNESILVTTAGVPEPALLATCRAIRKEALALFYHGKRLDFAMKRYDSSILMKWEPKRRSLEVAHADGYSTWSMPEGMQADKTNLCLWLWRYYFKIVTFCPGMLDEDDAVQGTPEDNMVRALFDTMTCLKAAHVSWEVIVEALQPGFTLLRRQNPDWEEVRYDELE